MAYHSVKQNSEKEIVIKKSRFIGRAFHVTTEEEALLLLAEIRKQHWDARHNCYAYRLHEGGAARFSDDGEPAGTAGMPMMDVLTKNGLEDILIIVTRYFGGILLGTGGLVRAYTQSALEAIHAAGTVEYRPCTPCTISVPYPLWGKVENYLMRMGYPYESAFAENVSVTVSVGSEMTGRFQTEITDLSDGQLSVVSGEEQLCAFAASLKEDYA